MSPITAIFSNLHFIRPMVLWLLPIVLFIIWQLQRSNSRDDGWSKICDPHLLDAIKINKGAKGSKWLFLLWPISIIAILAIAGPAFRKLPTPVIKNQSALIIVLDVSRSMLADDIKPNRLERAKFKINDILDKRKDGQTALIVYAGDAFVVTPLTDDTETIALMLKAISPDIMPVQGSRVDIALIKSQNLLRQAGYISGDVMVISDGVNLAKAQGKAEELASNNITTSVLAIGTKDGAPIPTQTGFVKDRMGNIVIPKLQISALRTLANSGNGRFAQISGDSADIDFVLPTMVDNEANNTTNDQDDAFDTAKYIDEGPWLTLLLLPFIALLFRKGLLLSFILVVGLQTPESSYAFDWDDMWLNADQKAAQQIQNGQTQQAFDTAKSDKWKATAAYRKKDYLQASELYNEGTADSYYNQGNSLAQGGKLQEAIKAYENSLKLHPDDEDTIYNKKQVEQALEQQQDQENKDQQDQDKKDKQDQEKQESQDNKDQQKQDGEGEEQDGEPNQDQSDNPEQQEQKEQQQSEMTDEEKQQQEEEQKQLEQADKEAEKQAEEKQQEVQLTPEELAENAENKEAIEQWLRRIPDDPGGLLRRKFYYQYNQQNNKPDEEEDW
ncbi:MAG: VWA domain-containing protein [Alcanivoracaceae bacterium]|nr:VWA domain-containing protein [Alcanivoracaceae bacterium]